MDNGKILNFSRTPRNTAESRMQTMSSLPSVRKAQAKAEVEFRSKEVGANWRSRPQYASSDQEIPPHWQAGVQYAREIIPAYGTATLEQFQHPAEFESFLRECEWVVSRRTHERKLQPYDQVPLKDQSRIQSNFHQLVRAAVAMENARLGLEAWQRYRDRLEKETAPVCQDSWPEKISKRSMNRPAPFVSSLPERW